ncbi:MAG: hypothetical protein PUD42_03855 [Clostridiales bacterium]|nr:hypothetical protein [Clostridiales bacterium]MDY2728691.1 hypothetical protein [Clostridium sp.]NLK24051.1 hypothetical protein [Clostridiales bacterium]
MLKKAISLSICLALLGSSVIASAETTNSIIDINTTYVGYGYTTSGDAVHCLQILLDVYAEDYGKPSVEVDGIFGPNTQNLLLRVFFILIKIMNIYFDYIFTEVIYSTTA